MSSARKRGLVRLAVLVVIVAWLIVLMLNGIFGGGSSGPATTAVRKTAGGPPARLRAQTTAMRLPTPLHGATAAATSDGILVIGGADRTEVSTDRVLRLDPAAGSVTPAGTLATAMHDAAAAPLGGRTLVFGGGATSGFDTIQQLTSGAARQVGRMPYAASDLSAVAIGDSAYVLGGYDGRSPVDSVLRTADGRTVERIGRLATAVRYTAAAALGDRIYAFGGELGGGGSTSEIQEVDTSTGQTTVVGHLPQPLDHASALVLGGSIFVLGGRQDGAATDRIYRFDPGRKTVVPAGHLSSPVFDAAAAASSDTGYLAGGIGSQGTSVDTVVTVRAKAG